MICIDEKPGIQAKYRKYPGRLPAPGRPARREFEYVRNRTVSVIAALQAATGLVVVEPVARNDSAAFTGFLHRLTQCIDPRLNIRIVMDNGSSHTSRATRARIAARPWITVTYTPWTWTYDARDDHARYRTRRNGQHPARTTAQPAAAQTIPQAASQQYQPNPWGPQADGGSFPWRSSSSCARLSAADPGMKLPISPLGPKSWSTLLKVILRLARSYQISILTLTPPVLSSAMLPSVLLRAAKTQCSWQRPRLRSGVLTKSARPSATRDSATNPSRTSAELHPPANS